MLGDVIELANNLWLIIGDLPADIPNALVYLSGDRMYLMDSGAGPKLRASIIKVLQAQGPVQSFTLLNSHAHADHVGNNDLIRSVQAKATHHYISEAGVAMLDEVAYFADQYSKLSDYYDPVTGFQANRLRWRFAGLLRDVITLFAGEQRALKMIISINMKKFQPLRLSPETIEFYESLPRQNFTIGGVQWTGWALGENDVFVLEARGHTPDEVLFYLPEHQLLHTGDLTFPLFPTFPASNEKVTRDMLHRCETMTSVSAVSLLTDGHHQQVYKGQDEIRAFLITLLAEHDRFQIVLKDIIEEHDGLTIGEVYAYVLQRQNDPVVRHYLSLEYPYLPMALQQIIAVSLSQMGYAIQGPKRKKRFYRSASVTRGQ